MKTYDSSLDRQFLPLEPGHKYQTRNNRVVDIQVVSGEQATGVLAGEGTSVWNAKDGSYSPGTLGVPHNYDLVSQVS